MKTAILLLGHGSRAEGANQGMYQVMESLRAQTSLIVETGFMELNPPSIEEGVATCVAQGAEKVIMIPYFLHSGMHVRQDLPDKCGAATERYPGVEIVLGEPLGFHPKLAEIVLERARKYMEEPVGTDIIDPREIEAQSFAQIDAEVGRHRFSDVEWPIVRRVIHATADFSFAQNFRFHPDAIQTGITALRRGCNIITDVRMVQMGINRTKLRSLGGDVHCFIGDNDVAQEAARLGVTRSIVSMRKAAAQSNGGIVVIGNAPTALLEILRLIQAGQAQPALIIGVPVGFVAAAESKEELRQLERIPFITSVGRKGGTPVAVATVNALLNQANMPLEETV